MWFALVSFGVGVRHGQGCHIHNAANGGARGEYVNWLACTEQYRAYSNATACGRLQQVVGDIGCVDIGHDQQISFGFQQI